MSSSSQAAHDLHREAIVIDLHADTFELVRVGYEFGKEHRSFALTGHLLGHVDLPRMQRGGMTAQFFGIVIPPWTSRAGASRRIARQVGNVDRTCSRLDPELVRARSADDVIKAHDRGQIAALVGVEGSYGIAGHAEALDLLASEGVMYMSPAHVFNAEAGPSNLRRREGTLSALGRELVEELRRRSILVDLAHMAREPFLEICRSTTCPVIVSHTGLAALQPMWRNIDDDQIRAVADTGGVIGVIMTPRYLGRPGVEGIVDHLEHLVDIGGEEVAALGSDFDGLVKPPRDLADIAGMPLITDELLRRGHGEDIIRKLLGENVLRVMQQWPSKQA